MLLLTVRESFGFLFLCLSLRRHFCLATVHKVQISGLLQWCLSFSKLLPFPHRIPAAQPPSGFFGYLSYQGPSPLIAVSPGSSRKSPGCSKVLPMKNYGGLGTFMQQNICSLPLMWALTRSCLWAPQAAPSTSWLNFAPKYIVPCETLNRQVCVFPTRGKFQENHVSGRL